MKVHNLSLAVWISHPCLKIDFLLLSNWRREISVRRKNKHTKGVDPHHQKVKPRSFLGKDIGTDNKQLQIGHGHSKSESMIGIVTLKMQGRRLHLGFHSQNHFQVCFKLKWTWQKFWIIGISTIVNLQMLLFSQFCNRIIREKISSSMSHHYGRHVYRVLV